RRYLPRISEDADLADDFVAIGTPVFFVNGRRVQPTNDLGKLRTAVGDEIANVEKLIASGTPPGQIYDSIILHGRGSAPLEIRHAKFSTFNGAGRGRGAVVLLEYCDYTQILCRLAQPTIDQLLAAHRDELAVAWVDLPDPTNDVARSAALT